MWRDKQQRDAMGWSGIACAGGVVADQQRRGLLFLGQGRVGLEAASAAGFVHTSGADDNQLFAFDQALRVNRGISAADANGEKFGDFFGDGQQARHRLERAAAEVGVEAGDDHALAQIRQLGADIHYFFAEELRFVDADDFGARPGPSP